MANDPRSRPRSEPVRVGVIGLGAVAQAVHLPLLDRLGDRFRIAAVADLSPSLVETLGARYRVPDEARTTDVGALLSNDRIDAAVILTSGSHGALAGAALEAGLPVFVEKPLAFTLAEADELEATVARTDGRVQVGYMKLYDPAVVRAGRILAERAAAGRPPVRSVEVTVLHPTSVSQLAQAHLLPPPTDLPAQRLAELRSASDALRTAALGDVPADLARLYSDILLGSIVHDLALIRAFVGDPVGIDHVDVWPERAWPPSVAIAGRLPGEARFSIRWHYLAGYPDYRESLRLHFDDGTIELLFPAPYLLHAPTLLTVTDAADGSSRDTHHRSIVEAFEEELLAFHALVTDGSQPAAGIAEGRADIITCQRIAAHLAAARGIAVGGEAARPSEAVGARDAAGTDPAAFVPASSDGPGR
jgi:myo-inositol 2-dehydrogenase/D-chiro-inositol 1-dehydrogenase